MKFYISTTGIKRVTISTTNSSAKGSTVATRRITRRTFLPVVLLLSIVLPFLFVRIAFLVLESASACNSALDCIGWGLLGGSEASLLREELTRALMEAKEGHGTNDGDYRREGSTESFNVLVNEMTSNQQDIKTFAFRTKAMVRVHTKMYL